MSFTSFIHPHKGFHFILTTRISAAPPTTRCELIVAYELPPDVIADKYELALRGGSYAAQIRGATDLELPSFVAANGSLLLLRVPEYASVTALEIPLHVRYGVPSARVTHMNVPLPLPVPVWACPDHEHETFVTPHLPSEIVSVVGGSASALFPIPQASGQADHSGIITAPLGNPVDLPQVQATTAIVLLSCFIHVLYATSSTAVRLHRRRVRKTD
ncbi:hypothetical protein PUNSTDRAFT_69992 [Punctularia strigosozonata HHB-11173 SS5]|uniref:uncharacterized protein n=1 Tax=Punctularia strigosozonata (strain HHB-11173) TaxID=741275 RepID=UPI0004416B6E|nr:uncharacterized protein PUNSTDRAFT_69992 [Punctularia strigosozonata HHB-11173 SS5]EIN07623.1 hypothetical protein PUNSTDRAFT_69992 [Punctularia strigosozonata HHB-11173 SS5]